MSPVGDPTIAAVIRMGLRLIRQMMNERGEGAGSGEERGGFSEGFAEVGDALGIIANFDDLSGGCGTQRSGEKCAQLREDIAGFRENFVQFQPNKKIECFVAFPYAPEAFAVHLARNPQHHEFVANEAQVGFRGRKHRNVAGNEAARLFGMAVLDGGLTSEQSLAFRGNPSRELALCRVTSGAGCLMQDQCCGRVGITDARRGAFRGDGTVASRGAGG